MPGLVEAHFHPTYFNVAELQDLDIKYPVEYVTLLASVNAKLALECGYTAARSGGSLFNIDVWLKKAIENDLVLGPRMAASGREICGVAGLMDWNPDFRKIGMEGLVLLVNGAEEARAAVRKLVKDVRERCVRQDFIGARAGQEELAKLRQLVKHPRLETGLKAALRAMEMAGVTAADCR